MMLFSHVNILVHRWLMKFDRRSFTDLGRNTLWRLDSNGRVPLARWQHCHLVQKLVNTRYQVISISGFVGNVVEHLVGRTEEYTLLINPILNLYMADVTK